MTNNYKLLVVDDEPSNVMALIDYLNSCGVETDYVPSLPQAAEYIAESVESGMPYDAVVLDNDFRSYPPGSEGYSPLEGIDFVNILNGKINSKDNKKFVREHFGDAIDKVVDEYANSKRVIMFSGSAYRQSSIYVEKYDGVPIAAKLPDRDGSCCEEGLVAILEETIGLDLAESSENIRAYKSLNKLEDGLTDHDRNVEAFFRMSGIPEDEILELMAA